jgi:predicted methyltransferase
VTDFWGRMRALVVLCLWASAARADFPADAPWEWFVCEKDEDCAMVPSACPPAVAVRKDRLEDARRLDKRSCLTIVKPPGRAECVDKRCTAAGGALDGLGGGGSHLHHFDRPAEEYAKHFDAPDRDRWQKPAEVVKLLGMRPGMVVVDLGAGTGYFMKRLSRAAGKDGRVLALDVETQLVEYMRARAARAKLANVEARKVAYDDPQLAAGSVDRVLVVDTWHHIEDREAYARKLASALRPGGRVVVVEVTKESPHGPPAEHRLEPPRVVKELEAGGLANVKVVKESLPRQYVVVGEARN